MMSGIRSKNTQPEVLVRRGLHRNGFRFRLHVKNLPGCPDLVLPRWNAVVFVHGCFWHGHDCRLFKWPATRAEFWRAKIARNREVDRRAATALRESGWRVLVVYECAIRVGRAYVPTAAIGEIGRWLRSQNGYRELGELR